MIQVVWTPDKVLTDAHGVLAVSATGGMRAAVQVTRMALKATLGRMFKPGPGRFSHITETIRDRINIQPDAVYATVWPSKFTAHILEAGAQGHLIYPKRAARRGKLKGQKQVLRFTPRGAGGAIFRTFAHHPPIRAYRWREAAQAEADPKVQAILADAIERGVRD